MFSSNTYDYFGMQSFTPTQTGTLSSFKWLFHKYSGNSYISQTWIYASDANDLPTGPVLATSDDVATSTFQISYDFVEYLFSGSDKITLILGTKYVAKVIATSGHSSSALECVQRMGQSTSITYSGGKSGHSNQSNNTHAGILFEDSIYQDASFSFRLNLEVSSTVNPINEYVTIIDSDSSKTDTTSWLNINNGSVNETLNSQNAYYCLAFDPASGFGDGTEIKVFNSTDSVWRVIAKNNAGTWEYNNDNGNSSTYTGANAVINDILHAVSQAIATQPGNRIVYVH